MIFRFPKPPKKPDIGIKGLRKYILALGGSAALLLAAPFIGKHEGREYVAYQDVGGVWTVCDGHTGSDIIIGKVYTDDECDQLFAKDLVKHERIVDQVIKTTMSDKTKAAVISFTFNVGGGNLQASTLARLANAGNMEAACHQLSRWVYVDKRIVQGLVNRRVSERELCLSGLDEREA